MKRILALLLVLVMCLSLVACGEETPNANETPNTGNEAQNEEVVRKSKTPSDDLIQMDIESALQEKNPEAVLTGTEVVKSLQKEVSYEYTLSITAESPCSDWVYEAEMFYTKYDQGWMLDEIKWISESDSLVRAPSEEYMVEIANNYFSTHESGYLNRIEEIKSGTVSLIPTVNTPPNAPVTERLRFEWEGVSYRTGHGYVDTYYISMWDYHDGTWVLVEGTGHYGDRGYEILHKDVIKITADISGTWPLLNGGNVTISDFTETSFTANWDGKNVVFQRNKTPNLMSQDIYYTDASGKYEIDFNLGKVGNTANTGIIIYEVVSENTHREIARGTISGNLPKLD